MSDFDLFKCISINKENFFQKKHFIEKNQENYQLLPVPTVSNTIPHL